MVAEGRAEVVSFEAQMSDGKQVTLKGILVSPVGTGSFPAVVMLPGATGLVTPYCYGAVADQFVAWGYLTFIPASTTARDREGNIHLLHSFLDQVSYAHGAAAMLARMPQIDSARIGVWGHSRGGLSVLYGVSSSEGRFGTVFRAAVAAAPQCPSSAIRPSIPLLMLIGSKDLDVSVNACTDLADRLEGTSGFEFFLIPDAGHSYWAPSTHGYNQAAALSAQERLKAFLQRSLNVNP